MNSSNTNRGYSQRRFWCNGGFRQAIEAVFGTRIFKQFTCITGTWNNYKTAGGTNMTSQDYFTLPADKETVGPIQTQLCTTNEADALTQFTWYATQSNRVKYMGESHANMGGWTTTWWERSPRYELSTAFCYINTSGKQATSEGLSHYPHGISPFGCI